MNDVAEKLENEASAKPSVITRNRFEGINTNKFLLSYD